MATQLKDYTLVDDETGKEYVISGPEDASPEELSSALGQYLSSSSAPERAAPVVAPSQKPLANTYEETPWDATSGAVDSFSVTSKDNPQLAALADSLFAQGIEDPEIYNREIGKFLNDPNYSAFTKEMIAQARKRDAWYKAKNEQTPGFFTASSPTGRKEVERPEEVFDTVGNAVQRSFGQIHNSLVGLSAVGADVIGADETADALLEEYIFNNAKMSLYFPRPVDAYKDVDSFGKAGLYAVDTLGEFAPQLVGSLGFGYLGKEAAKRIIAKSADDLVEKQVSEGVAREAAEAVAKKYVDDFAQKGAIVGAFGSSAPQEIGNTFGETYQETGEKASAMSIAAGLTSASLDSLLPSKIIKNLGVSPQAITGKFRTELFKQGAKGFALEGATEALQEFIVALPASVVKGESPFTSEMLDRMTEAFIRGGIGGGFAGASTASVNSVRGADTGNTPPATPAGPIVAPTAKGNTKAYKVQIEEARDQIVAKVGELAQGWTNLPEVKVHTDFSKVQGVDKTALGVYTTETLPDGTTVPVIRINTKMLFRMAQKNDVSPESLVEAVTFHEGLGHHGLLSVFGKDLEAFLDDIYTNGDAKFKAQVDKWLKDNPSAYGRLGSERRRIFATEEVLAETSEKGPLVRRKLDELANYIKDFARTRMGMNLKYSQREIRAYLAVAHDRTIRGKKSGETTSVVKNMDDKDNKFLPVGVAAANENIFTGVTYDKRGKPVLPGRVMGPEEAYKYYSAMAEWNEKRALRFVGSRAYDRYRADAERNRLEAEKKLREGFASRYGKQTSSVRPTVQQYKAGLDAPFKAASNDKYMKGDGNNVDNSFKTRKEEKDVYRSLIGLGVDHETAKLIAEQDLSHIPPKVREFLDNEPGLTPEHIENILEKIEKGERVSVAKERERKKFYPNPANDKYMAGGGENVVNFQAKKNEEELKKFHALFMEQVREKSLKSSEMVKILREEGKLPLEVGSRVLTPKARETGEGPWKVTGYYANTKDPLNYGYLVERGEESNILLVSDPKTDARIRKRNPSWNRRKEVEAWQIMRGPRSDKYMRGDSRKTEDEGDFERRMVSILAEIKEAYVPTERSQAEAQRMASLVGLRSRQYKSEKGLEDLDVRLFQYDAVSDRYQTRLLRLYEKRDNAKDANEYVRASDEAKKTLWEYNLLAAKIKGDQAQIGRALNAMKAINLTRRKVDETLGLLEGVFANKTEAEAFAALDDPQVLDAVLKQMAGHIQQGNKLAAGKIVEKIGKPYWWQYVLSYLHNSMLSGLGTQVVNTYDSLNVLGRKIEERILGGVIGQTRKALGAEDTMSAYEGLAFTYGALRAVVDAETYRNTWKTFKDGYENSGVNSRIEMQDARIPGVSKINDLLAASDMFWRSFHMSANMYSLGLRKAYKDGHRGKQLFEEAYANVVNAEKELFDEAKLHADEALLVDKPSTFTQKFVEAPKSIRPGMNFGQQTTSFLAHIVFPFARTTDRLIFQAFKRIPLLAFLDHNTRREWKMGGAARDAVMARQLMGAALLAYYWNLSDPENADEEGYIEGYGDPDYAKQRALAATGYRPESVTNEEGKMVAANQINVTANPFNTNNNIAVMVASIRQGWEKSKKQEPDANEAGLLLASAFRALGGFVVKQSYADNITPYVDAVRPDTEQDRSVAALGGDLGSRAVPAIVRQLNGMVFDPVKRDTKEDSLFGNPALGRMQSAIPGLSSLLPEKKTALGENEPQDRTLLRIDEATEIKQGDPYTELRKLERDVPEVVLGSFKGSFVYGGENIKLNSFERSKWQSIQGQYLKEVMAEWVTSEDWKEMTVEEKTAVVKDIKNEAYDYAKEQMLDELLDARGYGE